MSKTIRQRKDELLTLLINKKNEVLTSPRNALYEEYKKILTSNGIKNERLISAQLNKMLDLNLSKVAIYSNLKFINLARSRLTEEGISLYHAEDIIQYLDFNLSEINEDDDYIGDAALKYAELAVVIYNQRVVPMKLPANERLTKEQASWFNILPVQLPLP